MKARLTFNLDDPDDAIAHLRAVKSLDLVLALGSIQEYLRNKVRYAEDDNHLAVLGAVQYKVCEILDGYSIVLDDLVIKQQP